MATVVFDKKDLEGLLGKSLTKQEIEEKIPMIGAPLEKTEDNKLVYEVFPNRPDMLSVEGFARALRFFLGTKTDFIEYKTKKSGIVLASDVSVKKARPYIACGIIRNVKITEEMLVSLMQLQEKLHDTIGRKRKKVAVGLHELDKITPPFKYLAASPEKISFIPLDSNKKMNLKEILEGHTKGIAYRHILEKHDKYPVIIDKNNNVLSFPPIINAELTKVTKNTKNIFIDVTGTDKAAVRQVLNIISTAFAERGFSIETCSVDGEETPNLSPRKIQVNLDYINKILGLNLSQKEFIGLLKKMGFGYSGDVLIPPYRTDIMHEIDIAEDIAIAYGYQNFQSVLPGIHTPGKRQNISEFYLHAKSLLTGLGFQETVTMVLTNEKDEFLKMNLKPEKACKTLNPLSQECTICRKAVLPSLLKVLSQNKHRSYPQKLFETGDIVVLDETAETGAINKKTLATVFSDSSVGYESLSTLLDAFLKNLGIEYSLKKTSHVSFIPGRTADVFAGKEKLGIIGEIHPQVLNNWNLDNPVVGFEIVIESIYELIHRQKE